MRCPISPAPAERNSVNALALELLGVAKEYLGPAAPAFLSRELHALGVTANTVESTDVLPLAERARQTAAKVMDNKKAAEFAQALAQRGGRLGQPRVANDHRLASEAAASLFVSGHLRQAEAAYRELIRKYGDVDAIGGLARTLQSLEDFDAALSVLREGAGAFARRGDRVSAIALPGGAVEIAPRDPSAHRRPRRGRAPPRPRRLPQPPLRGRPRRRRPPPPPPPLLHLSRRCRGRQRSRRSTGRRWLRPCKPALTPRPRRARRSC